MPDLDFSGLSSLLLGKINSLLPEWLPGGRLNGREYCCGDIRGGQGDSFKVNLDTGMWAEFAGNEKGGDLISLYAAITGKSQGEAFKELEEVNRPRALTIITPPQNVAPPPMKHHKHGFPTTRWTYHDEAGRVIFYVARYDTPQGKEFQPATWDGNRWQLKAWPAPRPLYNLHKLASRPNAPVLIVEGEKCADAAEILTQGTYVVTTWPNGAKACSKAQWEFLRNRNILIWPDNDAVGKQAGELIARKLLHICREVKTLNVEGQPDGWDAADALAGGWTWDGFREWAKPRAVKLEIIVKSDDPVVDGAAYVGWDNLGLTLTSTGSPIINIDNVVKVVEGVADLKNLVWLDTFYHRIFTKWRAKDARPWIDADTKHLCWQLQREFSLAKMSKETVLDAVSVIAAMNERNEPRDWMDSLMWDGIPRVESFLSNYMGVDDSIYTRAISKNFWTGIAARTYWPGCQLDNMLVFKGKQGIRKSSALRIIGGKWYTAAGDNVLSKDFYEILQGKLIIEVAELAGFHNSEMVIINRVVTNPTDRFRVSYGHLAEDHPRQCIFAATTNEDMPLRDHTGGRRFWPVKCGEILIEEIIKNRSQLFAEAVSLYKAGTTWFEVPQAETEAEQEDNRQADVWEEVISDATSHREQITTNEIAQILKISIDKLDRMTQVRIGKCMRVIGYEYRPIRIDGKLTRIWSKVKEVLLDW